MWLESEGEGKQEDVQTGEELTLVAWGRSTAAGADGDDGIELGARRPG